MPDQGCAWHWTVNTPSIDHSVCERTWAGVASAHYARGSSGYTLYNWGVCDHGTVFKGRGWDRQSGANGTTASNVGWWAVVWIGGPGHIPTPAAIAAMSRLTDEAPGRKDAEPHFVFTSTACPGPDVTAEARAYIPGVPSSPGPILSIHQGDNTMLVYAKTGSGKYAALKGKRWAVSPLGRTEIDAKQWLKTVADSNGSVTQFEGDAGQCAELIGL